ncbi:MAG: hypothetical protein HRT56_08725 [Coraliomargarita sp.]|nr:hypothetical protein [Coraliomargarita sp.]
MKSVLVLSLLAVATPLLANPPEVSEIIQRARATVGAEDRLKNVVTLKITGRILPSDPAVPEAIVHIVARKPRSQRLEVRVGEVVETTILDGKEACMIRSNLSDDRSHRMRKLSETEKQRISVSTRQMFSYFRPHYRGGEKITYEGIEQRRGVRSHKLVYTYPDDGPSTTRFFAVNDDTLVAVITDQGVESVEVGQQVVEGINFPKKIDYFQGGKKLHTLVLQKIKVNKPLGEDVFAIPQAQRKETQPLPAEAE